MSDLSRFLLAVPRSDHEPAALGQLAAGLGQSDSVLLGYARLLALFGAVDLHEASGDARIRARSHIAHYWLNSMAAHASAGLPLIPDWETRGMQQPDGVPSAAWLLHALESHRSQILPDAQPTRVQRVAQVLIRRDNPHTGQPELLMQHDPGSGNWQLIGGRWRESDGADLLRTAAREADEELASSQLRYGADYKLVLVLPDLRLPLTVSPTFGALTQYHFWVYHMIDLQRDIVLGPDDRWVSVALLLGGAGSSVRNDLLWHIDEHLPGVMDRSGMNDRTR